MHVWHAGHMPVDKRQARRVDELLGGVQTEVFGPHLDRTTLPDVIGQNLLDRHYFSSVRRRTVMVSNPPPAERHRGKEMGETEARIGQKHPILYHGYVSRNEKGLARLR